MEAVHLYGLTQLILMENHTGPDMVVWGKSLQGDCYNRITLVNTLKIITLRICLHLIVLSEFLQQVLIQIQLLSQRMFF